MISPGKIKLLLYVVQAMHVFISQSSFNPMALLGSCETLGKNRVGSHSLLHPGIKPSTAQRSNFQHCRCLFSWAIKQFKQWILKLDIWGPFQGWLQFSTDPYRYRCRWKPKCQTSYPRKSHPMEYESLFDNLNIFHLNVKIPELVSLHPSSSKIWICFFYYFH